MVYATLPVTSRCLNWFGRNVAQVISTDETFSEEMNECIRISNPILQSWKCEPAHR